MAYFSNPKIYKILDVRVALLSMTNEFFRLNPDLPLKYIVQLNTIHDEIVSEIVNAKKQNNG